MTWGVKKTALALALAGAAFAQEAPKADLFVGYSFLRYNSAQTIPAFTANGGVATLGLNFNRYIGLEFEFGGYHNGNVNNHQFDSTAYSFLGGPRFSFNRARTVDPYFHVLFGGQDARTSICCMLVMDPVTGAITTTSNRIKRNQTNFAMAAGGGLDIKLSHVVMLRPIQIDYYLTRFEAIDLTNPTGPTSNRNQNNLRYAAGLVFNFGGEKAAPPPPPPPPPAPKMKACPGGLTVPYDQECPKQNIGLNISASPAEICSTDSARVAPTISLPQGAVAHWSINGEPISDAPVLTFGGAGRNPGSYRVAVKVTADGYNDATAETAVRVREYVPPSGTLSASPAEVWVGEKVTLTPSFSPGQCGGPLGPVSYSVSEGSVSGNEYDSTTVHFDPPGPTEQRKTINIAAKASDSRGSGSAETSVTVKQKAATMAKRLPDVIFPAKSERVNNCGKRVLLEELKALFDADPGGTVVFVGHVAPNETASSLDLKRALNAAAVISAGQGICAGFPASRIMVNAAGSADNGVDYQPNFCGTSTAVAERRGQSVDQSDDRAKFRRVEVWFVPTGGTIPDSAKNAKDAATLGVSSLGCPR
jgi:hypothetical protein